MPCKRTERALISVSFEKMLGSSPVFGHVVVVAARFLGDRFEELGVGFFAQGDRGDRDVVLVELGQQLGVAPRFFADAVGHQDDVAVGRVRALDFADPRGQAFVYVGAAFGLEPVDQTFDVAQIGGSC